MDKANLHGNARQPCASDLLKTLFRATSFLLFSIIPFRVAAISHLRSTVLSCYSLGLLHPLLRVLILLLSFRHVTAVAVSKSTGILV